MNTGIDNYIAPEEKELAQKREELAILDAELTDRELFLASLRAEIGAFEGRYLREVGLLYAELDEWNAKIAESAAQAAGTEHAESAAAQARTQAQESYAAAHGEAAEAPPFFPTPEVKKLFREVIKQIHPDTAVNEADRALRNHLTAQANSAYRHGDAEALRRILEEYKSSPESVQGEGATSDLERILRQIVRISRRLVQIEDEVAVLTSSEIAALMAKVMTARASGRDLLAEMTEDLHRRIQAARGECEAQPSNARSR